MRFEKKGLSGTVQKTVGSRGSGKTSEGPREADKRRGLPEGNKTREGGGLGTGLFSWKSLSKGHTPRKRERMGIREKRVGKETLKREGVRSLFRNNRRGGGKSFCAKNSKGGGGKEQRGKKLSQQQQGEKNTRKKGGGNQFFLFLKTLKKKNVPRGCLESPLRKNKPVN